MDMIFKYAWVLFIVVNFINAFIMRRRVNPYIELNPELKEGYDKLFKNFLIYGNIIWIIVAIGDLTGQTKSIFDFLSPAQFNPIVLLFHVAVIVLWIVGSYWVFLNNGAEFLVKHPGFFNNGVPGNSNPLNKNTVKLFWTLIIVGGIVGEIMMWKTSIPIKKFEYSPNSQLVYDFADRFPRFGYMLMPLLFVIIGFGIYIYNKKYVDNNSNATLGFKRKYGMVFGIIFSSFAVIFSVVSVPAILGEYFKTKSVYDNNLYQTTEGVVENFHPMPASGHDSERFTVNGIEFEFSDFDIGDYGYNNAASLGGAIKEGLKVRIGFFNNGYKNVILKLEIL